MFAQDLTITTEVCTDASEVRLTGPWWGWSIVGGPEASSNGDGTWTFSFNPAPTANMEYLLVVDGFMENLIPGNTSTGDWSCTPITDSVTYANRQWVLGSGDVSNVYGTCGSCTDFVLYGGCTDSSAINYNSSAANDDGSCEYPVEVLDVCIDPVAENYFPQADPESDLYTSFPGLTLNANNETCIYTLGCTSVWADNFNPNATVDDESCYRFGCTSDWADNYDYLATNDDESCYRFGCTSYWADNYDYLATNDDESCYRFGCTDANACNYNVIVNTDNGSCIYPGEYEFLNSIMDEYNVYSNDIYDVSSNQMVTYFSQGTNTSTSVNIQGSNLFTQGIELLFYTSNIFVVYIEATIIDFFNSSDQNTELYNCNGCINDSDGDGICDEFELVEGCTTQDALNYSETAVLDDGSCIFEFNVSFDNVSNVTDSVSLYNIYNPDIFLGSSQIAVGDLVGVFYLLDGILFSGGYVVYNGINPIQITIIGDDPSTPEIEGFQDGQEIIWIIQQVETEINYLIDVLTYAEIFTPNTEEMAVLEGVDSIFTLGCTAPLACNYNLNANLEDGSCIYSMNYLDCNGDCINDFDMDGECDEVDYDDGIGIDEVEEETPILLKMIDVLGREHKEHKKGMLLFYIYENGKVKKRVIY